jgi:uncharacterized surface protein with fasciclin (FAS1) repeats
MYWLRCLFLPALLLSLTVAQDPQDPAATVIDLLSDNVEFSYFLRVLQRNMLIPYLNQLQNFTLAAPVNGAFASDYCQGLTAKECAEAEVPMTVKQLANYIIKGPISMKDLKGTHIYHTLPSKGPSSPIKFHSDNFNSQYTVNDVDIVELDLYASEQNAYVQGIDKLLRDLKPVDQVISSLPDSLVFNSLASDNFNLSGKTILIPVDDSFQLEDYQINYLLTYYGRNDANFIFNSFILDGFYGGDVNATAHNANGYPLEIISKDHGSHIVINDTLLSLKSNILANDAVIHVFNNSALIPEIEFNVLKALVGLEASGFVDELLLHDLSDLITNNSIEQTIFYPRDSDQFSIMSKSSNLYHFVTERIDDLTTVKSLYDTRFCNTKKMGSSCQKIKAKKVGSNSLMLNNNILIESGPYRVGNTTIYLTDDDLRTPGDLLSSVNSVLHCSKSLGFLNDLGLEKLPNNKEGYTLFLPCFNSWDDFYLTLNFLKHNHTTLDFLMRDLILNGLVYTDFREDDSTYININDLPVDLKFISNEDGTTLKLQYDNGDLFLKQDNDIIFNQGVIHPIEQLLIPPEIDISIRDILEHSDADLFLQFFGFFPELEEIFHLGDYSILLPSASSLFRLDPFNSNSTLKEFLQLHVIPSSSIDDLYQCTDEIVTLNPKANLTCSLVSGHQFLQIANGADNAVRILNKGCTSTSKKTCVYSIDRSISLKWIDEDEHLHITLPGIAVGFGVILGAVLSVMLLTCLMLVVIRRPRKGSDSESRSDGSTTPVNETTALLPNNEQRNQVCNSFESGYSANANVNPIALKKKTPHVDV